MTIGWQSATDVESAEFSKAFGAGLMRMSKDFIFLLFFTDLCIPGGIMRKHFRWPGETVAKLQREFSFLMAFYLPLVLIVIVSYRLDKSGLISGLTMLSVLLIFFVMGVFLYRFFTPNGGVVAEYLNKRPHKLISKFRQMWLSMLIAIVVVFTVLVFMGYLFTGATLFGHLFNSVGLIYILVLVHGLVIRWLLLVRRRLDYQAALEKREAMRAAREARAKSTEESNNLGDEESIEIEEPEINLAALDADSRKLLNTVIMFAGIIGLWFIWSPVLPAFRVLNDIALWNSVATVDGVEAVMPVTLADMVLAIIVGIVAVKAAHGIPAFLEFALLQRISITTSGRYTITTLLRYTITGIGIVLFFNILGVKWSQIQWLVAALGVGIGFGLQEIVANFISGLIILFERPIRVGDTVTVGDVSGVVSRINIRATNITNFDRQELLVPNKEFITSRLLNWSLSDSIIRIRLPVGIAYGSDVTRAMALLKEAAEEDENVLTEPAPSVTFESFGDNALGLFLHAYVQSIDKRLRIITGLHTAINNKFNEAGIVISFPQRDIHFDTSEPLRINIEDTRQEKPA
jgi:potassium efflux system protein